MLSELLTNTGTEIILPGLGLDDMLREGKQNLNHDPRACSDTPVIRISFLKPETQSGQLTCHSSGDRFPKLRVDLKCGQEF